MNFNRSLEAAAYLVRLEGGSMNYMKLVRLLYIAERELLVETGISLTGDTYTATTDGPILSLVYDHIKGRPWTNPAWQMVLRTEWANARLVSDPGQDHLSPYFLNKLNDIRNRYAESDAWLNNEFPEWIWTGRPRPISLEAVVFGAGGSEDTLEAIEDLAAERQIVNFFREQVSNNYYE